MVGGAVVGLHWARARSLLGLWGLAGLIAIGDWLAIGHGRDHQSRNAAYRGGGTYSKQDPI